DLDPVDEVGGQLPEGGPPHPGQLLEQLGDGVGDRGPDRGDVVELDPRRRLGGDRPQVGPAQVLGRDAGQHVGRQPHEALVDADRAADAPARLGGHGRQRDRRLLEGLALDEAVEQEVALLPQRQLVVDVHVVALRQQAAGLQLDERGRDEQELAGHVEVEALHPLELGEVAVDDGRQLHLVEVDLLGQDEVEQQVEGALEDGGLHLVGHRGDDNHQVTGPTRTVAGARNRCGDRPEQPLRSAPMARVFSGIQPTGEIHLGNYLGAVRRWVATQHDDDALYCIVDLHALTVPKDPTELRAKILELAQVLVAAGLDPEVVTLFAQSHVAEHTELGWVMECTASFGELRRMTQFKEKAERSEFVSAGLFTYPALMAADILLYDTEKVPVGDDQRQHLELARDL